MAIGMTADNSDDDDNDDNSPRTATTPTIWGCQYCRTQAVYSFVDSNKCQCHMCHSMALPPMPMPTPIVEGGMMALNANHGKNFGQYNANHVPLNGMSRKLRASSCQPLKANRQPL